MKSLYLKVLTWFLFTVAVTGIGLWWVVSVNWSRAEQSLPPFRRIAQLEFELARRAYEQGGREDLVKHLEWVRTVGNFSGVLSDASGRDLATGESHAEVIERLQQDRPFVPPGAPVLHQGRLVNGFRSTDGRYWFLHGAGGGGGGAAVLPHSSRHTSGCSPRWVSSASGSRTISPSRCANCATWWTVLARAT